MKRPLTAFAAAALAGILWGISETSFLCRSFYTAAVLCFHIRKEKAQGGRSLRLSFFRGLLFVSAIFFAAGFFRASYIKNSYDEKYDFFSQYQATNPGQFDYALYLKGEGISSERELDQKYNGYDGEDPFRLFIDGLSERLKAILDRYMAPVDAGIYKAILLGDKTDMGTDIKELYQASGISHIIAVSGLHISLIGISALKLFRMLRMKRSIALIAASILSFLYVELTGSSGSAVRALIMLFCRFAAMAAMREYDMLSAISTAFIVLIFQRPYIVMQSGFQLSFLAVLGLSVLGGGVSGYMELLAENRSFGKGLRFKRYISPSHRLRPFLKTLISNLSVQLFTLPALCFHFFTYPVYGTILNLVVIPLTGLVMYSGIAVLFIGMAAERLSWLGVLAVASGGAGHYILEFYRLICELSLGLPKNEILMGRPGEVQIIAYIILILLAVWLMDAGSLKKGIMNCGKALSRLRKAAPFVLLLFSPLLLYKAEDRQKELEISMLDVGQGDCILARYDGEVWMFDGGSASEKTVAEDIIKPYLMYKGIRYIDRVFVSHGDEDHISGIEELLSEKAGIGIGELVLPEAAASHEAYKELTDLFFGKEQQGSLVYAKRGMRLGKGLLCLYGGDTDTDEVNRHSPVFLLSHGDFSMLMTGDMTKEDEETFYIENAELLERLLPYGTTVLKSPHHGSKTSSSDQMLKAARPRIALISYGRGNRFGHPHEEVLKRYGRYGMLCLETGKHGAIEISTDGNQMDISTYIETRAEYIETKAEKP